MARAKPPETADEAPKTARKAKPKTDDVRIRTTAPEGYCPHCGASLLVERASIAKGEIDAPRSALRAVARPPDPDAPSLTATEGEARTEVVTVAEGEKRKGGGKLVAVTRRAPTPADKPAKRDRDGIHRAELDGATVEIRAADADGRRLIAGIAAPYGRPTLGPVREYGAREQFAAGAFARLVASRGDRPVPVLDRHDGTVVGGVTISDSPDGLQYEGRLLRSAAAADLAEQIEDGLVRPSIEFLPAGAPARRSRDLVEHADVGALAGIAFTYRPAYGETTASIRESGGNPMDHCEHCGAELRPGVGHTCPTADPAIAREAAAGGELPISRDALALLVREAADEAFRRNAGGGTPTIDDEYAVYAPHGRSLGALIQAAAQDGASRELRSYAARALADITSESGANAGAMTSNTFGDIRRLVVSTRPSISAFGGPGPLEGDGLSTGFPYYDGTLTDLVAEQTTQKSEIESAAVDIKRGTVTIKTYAGGGDVAYQLIRRASKPYLEMYGRILLAAWALVTNGAFVTALEAGSVTGDFAEALAAVDAAELKNLFVDGSVAVHTATGSPAEFVLAGTNAFKAAAKLMPWQLVGSATGQASARTLEVNVSGLPVIHDPQITTAKFIISNRQAARWLEDGPFQASAEDVAKLGRNVAYWSLGAAAIYVPAAVIEIYDVTP